MNAERSLKIIAAATACMGTAMLGIGEENYLLVIAAVGVSITALIVCDLKKWFCLNNTGSNIAALVMLGLAALQLRNTAFEQRILVMADLLGYLQFVLQFRAKTTRNYWLLLLVSFLQACVAAALHTGVTFGVMLTVYLFCGVFFLGYFYFVREQQRFEGEMRQAKRAAEKRGFGFAEKIVAQQPSDRLGGEFSRRMTGIVLGTVVLSALFFVIVPRTGRTNWAPEGIVGPRAVGFSSEINLTRTGEIIEDPEEVMQVRFFDDRTNLPYQVDGEIYMRGTSASRYFNGRWERGVLLRSFTAAGLPQARPTELDQEVIRQTVTIEPHSSPTLFSTAPAYAVARNDQDRLLQHNPVVGQLTRMDPLRGRRFQYELITPAISNHKQLALVPLTYDIDSPVLRQHLAELLYVPRGGPEGDPLPQLKGIAAAIVADLPPEMVYERAKRLEAYLRDSGRFSYSLDAEERPPGVDPLEDFITERPRGHCEFFAGALALMLRSVNIPARVVLGYRGGEYNVVGNFYQFQQLHAHSWVEAYLPSSQVPTVRLQSAAAKADAERYGAWLQLDGTPTASTQNAGLNASRWYELIQMSDYIRFLWNNYVVGMDAMQQSESIYLPLMNAASDAWTSISSRDAWKKRWEATTGIVGRGVRSFANVRTLLMIVLVAGLVSVAVVFGRKQFQGKTRAAGIAGPSYSKSAPAPIVEFYQRFEQALKSADRTRAGNQTQREFGAAAGSLFPAADVGRIGGLQKIIVEAYYRVRFGKEELDTRQRGEVELALNDLNAALDVRRRRLNEDGKAAAVQIQSRT